MKKVKWKYFTQPLSDPHRTALEHQALNQLALDSGFDVATLAENVEPLQQIGVRFISCKENARISLVALFCILIFNPW